MTDQPASPSLLNRPWTEAVQHPANDEHPSGYRTFVVKRACNGCGAQLGDMTEDEMAAAISGWDLPDVRHECVVCASDAPAPLELGEMLDPARAEALHLDAHLAAAGWEPADGALRPEAIALDWVVVRAEETGRPLLLKLSPDIVRDLRP